MGPVNLVESPQQILRRSINIISTRVVREVVAQRRAAKLLLEKIDLVEEEDDTGAHEPSRIDDRIEQY